MLFSLGTAPGCKEVLATGAKHIVGGIAKAGVKDIVNNTIIGTIIAEGTIWISRIYTEIRGTD